MGPLLADESHPKTLEEFVNATTPPRTKETFDKVVALLETQRMFIEAHLQNFKTSQNGWQRWATNIWNAVPSGLVKQVNEVFVEATFANKTKAPVVPVEDGKLAALESRLAEAEAKLVAAMTKISQLEKGQKTKEKKEVKAEKEAK